MSVVDVFSDDRDLGAFGFKGVDSAAMGRPVYQPAILLKIYIYGYLNRMQSNWRLERGVERNLESMWLTGRLLPGFKPLLNFARATAKPFAAFSGNL